MAGLIKKEIDKIISERAKGDALIEEMMKTKLILKGVNPLKYTESSHDDEDVLEKVRKIARDLGVKR